MDLESFKPKSDTVVVELVSPDGDVLLNADGTPMSITCYSSFSKQYRAIQDEITDARIEATFKDASKAKNSRKKKAERSTLSMAEMRESALELAVKTTVSWNLTMGGSTPECTEANIRGLYLDLPFILDQVQERVNDYSAFLGNS